MTDCLLDLKKSLKRFILLNSHNGCDALALCRFYITLYRLYKVRSGHHLASCSYAQTEILPRTFVHQILLLCRLENGQDLYETRFRPSVGQNVQVKESVHRFSSQVPS